VRHAHRASSIRPRDRFRSAVFVRINMTSQLRRDPRADPLLTPENCALVLIDYQAPQIDSVRSTDSAELIANAATLADTAKLFKLPCVLTTIGVESGAHPDTWPSIESAMNGVRAIDRTCINAWEDADFVDAVGATGRKKLIMAGLWTEVALALPALDALRDGFEVFVPVDAIGGFSPETHAAGLQRVIQLGAQPVSAIAVLYELQRDWNRRGTAAALIDIACRHGQRHL
jgi:nicotinamidase-related amidase